MDSAFLYTDLDEEIWMALTPDIKDMVFPRQARSASVEPKCDPGFKSGGEEIMWKHRSTLRLRERVVGGSLELK